MKTDHRAGSMIWVVLTVMEDETPGLRKRKTIKKMKAPLETIIRRMVDSANGNRPLSGFAASDQFHPEENGEAEIARNLNAAFLIVLSGSQNSLFEQADEYLETMKGDKKILMKGKALFP